MKRSDYYILDDDKNIVPCDDVLKWDEFFSSIEKRTVKKTVIDKTTKVSTVFLGIDHGFFDHKPILFETMVFSDDKEIDLEQNRCDTYENALKMHAVMVKYCKKYLNSKTNNPVQREQA